MCPVRWTCQVFVRRICDWKLERICHDLFDKERAETARQDKLDGRFVAGSYTAYHWAPLQPRCQKQRQGVYYDSHPDCNESGKDRRRSNTEDKFNYCAYMLCPSFRLGAKTDFMWKSNVFALKCYVLFLYLFYIIYESVVQNWKGPCS